MIIDERGPKHIAIILDGNRRWAKAKGLKPTEGHKAGAEAVKNIVKYAYDCGLKYLTVYAFSTENWKRDASEVSLLMKLLDKFTSDLLVSDEKREIKIKVYGDISALDKKLQDKIIKLEEKTKNNNKMVFGICLNYGGRDEIVNAIKEIVKDSKNGKISEEDITQELVSKYLYTKDVPDPDFIIRTSNEYRLSNFLTWQSTYSELYFPKDVMWPDFDQYQFDKAIEEYIKRNRRFGGN
jgi:undecaprenyl diphosphate synthase